MTNQKMTDVQRELAEKNIDLAHHLALSAWRLSPHTQDKDEVVAAAYEGLVNAAARFDPSRADIKDGVADISGAFAGYARQKINGAIMDWQRKRDHVPKRTRRAYKELQGHGLGDAKRSAQELSDLTGMPEDKIRMVISAVEHMPVPIHIEVDAEESPSMVQRGVAVGGWAAEPAESRDVEEQALATSIQDAVVEVFDALPDLQQLVIAMRYYEGLDLTTISTLVEVRLAAVRAAHAEGLLALHAAMVRQAS